MADQAAESPGVLEFGRFKLDRYRREIVVDGRSVELGGRAFDTLLALVVTLPARPPERPCP